jgi:hypothetical protein
MGASSRTSRSPRTRRTDGTIAARIARSDRWLATLFVVVVVAMANLNAIVDCILHPENEYVDSEHLIVGGITALVSAVLFGALMFYVRHLRSALDEIRTLQGLLPICAGCKKIRVGDGDPSLPSSWTQIEAFLSETTAARFSHGICPECRARLYPEFAVRE